MRIGSMKVKNSRILLPRVRFYAHHGVDPQEQLTGAYFHVGIEADTDFNEAMQTDRLEGTVSYADLYESIKIIGTCGGKNPSKTLRRLLFHQPHPSDPDQGKSTYGGRLPRSRGGNRSGKIRTRTSV